jgi:hypothetical protein
MNMGEGYIAPYAPLGAGCKKLALRLGTNTSGLSRKRLELDSAAVIDLPNNKLLQCLH